MRLPAASAQTAHRLRYSRYTARRLRRAKLPDDEAEVKAKAADLKAAVAAEAEAEEALQDALADRDAADDDLDDVAKRHRRSIEGRGTNANRERPYIDLYAEGIEYFTSAPIEEQDVRYRLLVKRYGEHLPDGDPVRAEAGLITAGLATWSEAKKAIDDAEIAAALAGAKTQRATEAWATSLTRLYHRLAERFGRATAERFFPRGRRAGQKDGGDDGGGGGSGGTPT
ncbi:MAG: hypothetical protein U1F43_00375 [Myxococcota bacterium]